MKSTINSPVTRRSFIKNSTILTGASLISYSGFGNSFSIKYNSLPFLSAAEAANEIRKKNISSFELTQMILERIKAIPSSQRTPSQSLQIQAISDSHIQYNKMESNRLRARMIWQKFFNEYDAFILPTAFVPAFPHTTKPWEERLLETPEGQRPFNDMLFWISFATHTGLPASVFPIGVSKTGLPVSLQVIGPFLEDATPIDIAGKLNEIMGGIRHPQGY